MIAAMGVRYVLLLLAIAVGLTIAGDLKREASAATEPSQESARVYAFGFTVPERYEGEYEKYIARYGSSLKEPASACSEESEKSSSLGARAKVATPRSPGSRPHIKLIIMGEEDSGAGSIRTYIRRLNVPSVYYTKEDIRTAFGVRRVPKEEVSEEACASPSSSHGTRLEGEGASVESCCPLASDERGLKKVSSTLELSSNRSFISKCNRAIIVYDANSRESFEQLDFWTKEIYRQVGDAISVLLIANRKAHRGGSTIVSSEEGREYADMYRMDFMEVESVCKIDRQKANIVKFISSGSKEGVLARAPQLIRVSSNPAGYGGGCAWSSESADRDDFLG